MERTLAALDDIARERRRIADRLARLDEERAKLTEELGELDAAERVLARLSGAPPRPANWVRRSHSANANMPRRRDGALDTSAIGRRHASPPPQNLRPRTVRSAGKKLAPSLGDATLQAVEALGGSVSAAEVRSYLQREFGIRIRANHLGMALQRHRRAGRLEQRETRWSVPGVQ